MTHKFAPTKARDRVKYRGLAASMAFNKSPKTVITDNALRSNHYFQAQRARTGSPKAQMFGSRFCMSGAMSEPLQVRSTLQKRKILSEFAP